MISLLILTLDQLFISYSWLVGTWIIGAVEANNKELITAVEIVSLLI